MLTSALEIFEDENMVLDITTGAVMTMSGFRANHLREGSPSCVRSSCANICIHKKSKSSLGLLAEKEFLRVPPNKS